MDIIINLKKIRFRWKDQTGDLLEIDDFSVCKGERVFLRGASGSGKSSLLSLLAGIMLPQSGLVEILGRSLSSMKGTQRDQFRADHIGYIFQMFNLVPYLSVIENVTLPCYFSQKRFNRVANSAKELSIEAQRLLEHLGLSGNEVLNKPVTELSVGQQQRVAACRALIGNPELLIADEPTSSLDEDAQKAFIDLLSSECRENNITLVFVSHDTRFTRLFDRNAELKGGRIVFGTPGGKGGAG